eukprot:scaffold8132_cov85-Isochrysis_galbana.AAC.3
MLQPPQLGGRPLLVVQRAVGRRREAAHVRRDDSLPLLPQLDLPQELSSVPPQHVDRPHQRRVVSLALAQAGVKHAERLQFALGLGPQPGRLRHAGRPGRLGGSALELPVLHLSMCKGQARHDAHSPPPVVSATSYALF